MPTIANNANIERHAPDARRARTEDLPAQFWQSWQFWHFWQWRAKLPLPPPLSDACLLFFLSFALLRRRWWPLRRCGFFRGRSSSGPVAPRSESLIETPSLVDFLHFISLSSSSHLTHSTLIPSIHFPHSLLSYFPSLLSLSYPLSLSFFSPSPFSPSLFLSLSFSSLPPSFFPPLPRRNKPHSLFPTSILPILFFISFPSRTNTAVKQK